MNSLANITPVASESFALSAAVPVVSIPFTGEFVICRSADEDFEVAINRGSKSFPLGANGKFRMPTDENGRRLAFDYIEFRRKSGALVASNAVTVIIGSGDYETGNVQLSATVTNKSAATLTAQAVDLTLTVGVVDVVLNANAARRCARIRNLDATDSFRISTSPAGLAANRGELVRPGEAVEIFVTGLIYAKPLAGAPTLNAVEELF